MRLKAAYRFRFVPIMLSAIFAFIGFAKWSAVSLPYQDPTADMLQEQSRQISIAENWLVVSGLVLISGVAYCLIISKLRKR